MHALSRRPEMKTNLKDWVGAFANLRSNSISLHQLEELVVSFRTANRSSLEHFFSIKGLDKLTDTSHRFAFQQELLTEDAFLTQIFGNPGLLGYK